MIVRKNLKWSVILRLTWPSLLFFVAAAAAAPLVQRLSGQAGELVPGGAVSALSAALAIFLAFRNGSAYDRWWEGRKLWGRLVNTSRLLAVQARTLLEDPRGAPPDDAPAPTPASTPEVAASAAALRRILLRRHLAYVNALRLLLRRQPGELGAELRRWLPEAEAARLERAPNPTFALVLAQGESLASATRGGMLDEFRRLRFDQTLAELLDIQGGCERIKNTPLPRQYEYFPRVFVYIYAAVLPLSLAATLGPLTPLVAVPIAFLFLALENIGRITQDPFENRIQDVPLSALSRTIERDLLDILGEPSLPPPLEPKDGFLF